MNKILSSLLKSNFFILGIGLAFIVLSQSEINIPVQFEYMIAKASLFFVIGDTFKIISGLVQNNELDNYRYNFLCNLEKDDVSEFIVLGNFRNKKIIDIIVKVFNNLYVCLVIVGFASIIILPLKEYDASITADIKNLTLMVFAFVFLNIFLNGVSDNLSGYYHEIFKTRYLQQQTTLIAKRGIIIAERAVNAADRATNTVERAVDSADKAIKMSRETIPEVENINVVDKEVEGGQTK